ncbi:hypothetical protein K439DRAFT_1625249 [Ramaria rubella]|nr:hypothetical protein K439DRAFT_1625249 [Ramaria rubella]
MSQCYLFISNDDCVFVSPNTSSLPIIPPMCNALPDYWNPLECLQVSWSYNVHPFLGFVISHNHWDDPLFLHIAYQPHNVPVACLGTHWRIPEPVQESWQCLETALYTIYSRLVAESTRMMPLDLSPCVLPLQFKFDFAVEDEHYACKRAMKCVNAFKPLMATCSFVISLHNEGSEKVPWYQVLQQHGVHPEWINGIKASPIADFSVAQVSVIVNMSTCQWLSEIPVLIRANVPLWLYYGTVQQQSVVKHRMFTEYHPSDVDIDMELTRRNWTQTIQYNLTQTAEHDCPVLYNLVPPWSSPPPPSGPPALPHHSRQHRSETWKEYFVRLEASRLAMIAKETDKERLKRTHRE